MKIRFLKSAGILFALAVLFVSFAPMKAEASNSGVGSCEHQLQWYDASETTHSVSCMFGYDCGLDYVEPHTFVGGQCTVCGYLNRNEPSNCNHSFEVERNSREYHSQYCIECCGFYLEPHTLVNNICTVCEAYITPTETSTQTPAAECVHDWYVDVTTPGDAYVHAIVCVKCGVGGASEHIFANGVDGVCLDCGAEIIDSSSFAAVFDALYYAEANPDLKAVFGDNEDLLFSHFIDCGMAEGRVASAEFNVHAYRAYYPDLVAVFGDDLALYYHHYMNSGKAEGRFAK